ncbi:hypothetical protein BSIN_0922 [Burkholderia singularis]|uniref:Uncharacterized protein n=1 Tax=Burkholderia singularis TaxID=1503053 RepID=A0A238HAY2_9BURK|nr:hypothetical protein BSIN_0922 [Burkholderia singularis]
MADPADLPSDRADKHTRPAASHGASRHAGPETFAMHRARLP